MTAAASYIPPTLELHRKTLRVDSEAMNSLAMSSLELWRSATDLLFLVSGPAADTRLEMILSELLKWDKSSIA